MFSCICGHTKLLYKLQLCTSLLFSYNITYNAVVIYNSGHPKYKLYYCPSLLFGYNSGYPNNIQATVIITYKSLLFSYNSGHPTSYSSNSAHPGSV